MLNYDKIRVKAIPNVNGSCYVSRYRLGEDKKELINFYDRDSTPLTNRYRWGRNLTMSQLARATGERLRPLM